MDNIDPFEQSLRQLIIRIFIIFNAVQLGWIVEIDRGQIILSKHMDRLTKLDKNTEKLINALISNEAYLIECM